MMRQEDASASAVDQAVVKCAQLSLGAVSPVPPCSSATADYNAQSVQCCRNIGPTGHFLRSLWCTWQVARLARYYWSVIKVSGRQVQLKMLKFWDIFMNLLMYRLSCLWLSALMFCNFCSVPGPCCVQDFRPRHSIPSAFPHFYAA